MKWFKAFFAALVFGVLIAGVAFLAFLRLVERPLPIEQSFVYELEKGSSSQTVISDFHNQGLIEQPLLAKLYIRYRGVGGKLKAGEFEIEPGLTISSLFALLSSNQQVQYAVTLVEGSTFREALDRLASESAIIHTLNGLSEREAFEKMLGASPTEGIPSTKGLSFAHPEGSIYPDTYFFHRGESDLSILQRAHRRLVSVLEEEWAGKSSGLPLVSPYEALILASIIEKETGVGYERGEIAGVFVRRLNKGMRLQTDPTVIYGLGDRYKGNITRAHLRELTPYNTYRINGLPPTPIALAGRAAIHAALHPAEGETLYFVARGDGTHAFSVTIEQHNKAVREYQLKRRSDYRSSPGN